MAFDAEPAPSDRRSPQGRRSRAARRRRGRSIFGVESLETRVLLSSGDPRSGVLPPLLAALDGAKVPASQVDRVGQPDGTPPQGVLGRSSSIPDALSSDPPSTDAEPWQGSIQWHVDVLPDFAGPKPIPFPASPESTTAFAPTSTPAGSGASGPSPAITPPLPPGVLPEISEAHSTRSSAQLLPSAGETEIDARWSPGDILDLYRISMHPDTQALRVGLIVPTRQAGSPDHLILCDSHGNLLGDQPLPLSPSGMSVLLTAISKQAPEQTIYVGVYSSCSADATASSSGFGDSGDPATSIDGSSSSVPYFLDVTLIDNSPSAPTPTPSGSASTADDAYLSAAPIEPPQSGAGQGSWGGSSGSTSSTSLSTTPISLALTQSVGVPQQAGTSGASIRPSPWRTVAPLGGALTTRDETRGVDRRAGAYVDFNLLPVPETPGSTDGGLQTAEQVVEPVSIGGLPILGASLPAVRNTEPREEPLPHEPPPDLASAAVLEASAERAKQQAQAEQAAQPIAAITDGAPASRSPDDRSPSPGLLRAGVGLAYALAFTCLLPDLSAVFHAAGGRKRRALRWGHFRRWFRRS